MNCPYCHRPIPDGQTKCENCGRSIVRDPRVTGEHVYPRQKLPRKPLTIKQKERLVIIVLAALCVIAAIVALIVLLNSNKKPSSSAVTTTVAVTTQAPTLAPTTAPPTTPPATTAPVTTAPATTAPETTAAATTVPVTSEATTAPLTSEQLLMDYAKKSGMLKTLQDAADDKTKVEVKAERNQLFADYVIDADATDRTQEEYFSTVKANFESLKAQLDRPVYDMKTESGVENAVLQITVVDRNRAEVFSAVIN